MMLPSAISRQSQYRAYRLRRLMRFLAGALRRG